jgi:PAS domain S-box-containing protein
MTRRRSKVGVFALCFAAALLLAFGAQADHPNQHTPIIVGSELDYPPYALVTKDGEADGFSVDLMKAVCHAEGFEPTFRVGPWSEVRAALENGEIDALPLVSFSKEREKVFDFTMPHTVAHGVVFKREGSQDINSASDLRGKTIIVMRSDAGHDWLLRNDISENLVLTETVAESLRMLAEGKHDYALAPRLVGLLTAKELGLSSIEVTGPLLDAYGRGYGFAVKEGNIALLAHLNEGLSTIKATGRYDEIYEKWFGAVDPKGIPTAVIVRYVAWVAGVIVVLGGLIILWIIILRRTVRRQTTELQTAHNGLELRVEKRTQELSNEIAERKRAGEELRLSKERFRELVEGSLEGILIHKGFKPVFANQSCLEMFGYGSMEEMVELSSVLDLISPSDRELAKQRGIDRARGGNPTDRYEVQCLRKDGSAIWINLMARAIDWKGEAAIQVTTIDITERKRAEEELTSFFNVSSDWICVANTDGYFTRVSPVCEQMLGWRGSDFVGEPFMDFVHPEDIDATQQAIERQLSGEPVIAFVNRYRCKDGSYRWLEWAATPAIGKTVFAIARDITERKRTEEALKESAERFRNLIEGSIQGIYIHKDFKPVFVNQTCADIFGYDCPDDIFALSSTLDLIAPHERARTEQYGRSRIRGGEAPGRYEAQGIRKDGSLIWMEQLVRVVNWLGEPVIQSTVFDITERKQMERQLLHSQKMEAVGQLTGGIAHDFNNLLQIVATNVELVQFGLEEGGMESAYLDTIGKAAARGGALTQQLLAFSRRQTLSPITVDPNGLIEGMMKILGRTLGEDIEIKTSLDEDIPSIIVDPNAFENAVLNLAINAKAAMPGGGKLTVASGRKRMDEDLATEDGFLPASDYIEISLTDTGCGMSPEVLERAVEPFFTTKDVGEGSGLGLSMVYGFAEQSGGHLFLESEPGKGSTVRIVLPVSEEVAEATHEALPKMESGRGSGTILVVEDDPDVRGTAMLLLKSFGYEVREAQDAVAALEVLEKDGEVNLLFTDVVMPTGMNGFQLAEEASRRYPGFRVVLTSGYPETELERTGLRESGFTLLKKPYSQRELTDALNSIIGA